MDAFEKNTKIQNFKGDYSIGLLVDKLIESIEFLPDLHEEHVEAEAKKLALWANYLKDYPKAAIVLNTDGNTIACCNEHYALYRTRHAAEKDLQLTAKLYVEAIANGYRMKAEMLVTNLISECG